MRIQQSVQIQDHLTKTNTHPLHQQFQGTNSEYKLVSSHSCFVMILQLGPEREHSHLIKHNLGTDESLQCHKVPGKLRLTLRAILYHLDSPLSASQVE